LTAKTGLTKALNQPVPQTSRTAQTMIQGVNARQTSAVVGSRPGGGGGGIVSTESSRRRSAGEVHSSAGCHTLKKTIRQAMQISEAPISTIQGLT